MSRGFRTTLLDRVVASRAALPRPRAWHRATVRIPMRDGVELGADLYTPSGASRGLLLTRGPYGRGAVMALMGARLFAAQGYTVLFASTRGTADSGGVLDPMRDEVEDGVDLVAWMREQPWFRGRFGTIGASYLGHTQWAMLADPPEEVAASVVVMGPHDFSRHFWGTGSFNFDLLGWSRQVDQAGHDMGLLRTLASQASFGRNVEPIMRALPVVPAADAFFSGLGKEWVHQRLVRPDLADPFWRPMQHADALERTTTPTLVIAGWQDLFLRQSLEQYVRLRERGVDAALTVGAWTHLDLVTAQDVIATDTLDWLDAHLAGSAPLRRRSAVRVQVTGADRWIDLPDWPDAASAGEALVLHLHPARRLAVAAPGDGAEPARFVFDPADPTPAIGGNQIATGGYRDDSVFEGRPDALTFDSDPLDADVTFLGDALVVLAHSTELPDADLFVRLSDVDERRRSRNVTEAYRRVDGGGPSVELTMPGAHTFRAGHRIRLVVAGGSFPQFSRNPGTGENPLTATALRPNLHTVGLSGGASTLTIPVTAAPVR